MSDGNEFLMSGGVPSVPFEHVGTTITMRITSPPQKRAVTDPATGEVKTFQNGDPIYQVTVGVATGLRDPSNPDDNGDRTLFVKNKMLGAIREAVKRVGATGLEVGGTLTVSFIGEEPPKQRGLNPTKHYSAQYQPPPPGAAGNEALMGNGSAAAPAGYSPQGAAYAQQSAGWPPAAAQSATAPPPAAPGLPWAPGQAPWLQGAGGQPVAAQQFAAGVPAAAQSATMASVAQPSAVAVAPPPPAPPGVNPAQWPGMWAQMSEAQRGQVIAALANMPPF